MSRQSVGVVLREAKSLLQRALDKLARIEEWQDADRTYLSSEQQLDDRIDWVAARREAALVLEPTPTAEIARLTEKLLRLNDELILLPRYSMRLITTRDDDWLESRPDSAGPWVRWSDVAALSAGQVQS